MEILELVKTEREFLAEMETEKNDNDVYLFISENGKEHLSLDLYLLDYKQWLIEKGIVIQISK